MTRDDTQTRLLEVALNEFGAHGLDGASTRKIAAAAGTAMSAITYHYGGKQGLYLAAADYISERLHGEMAARFEPDPVADGDAAGARRRLHEIVARFAEKMTTPTTDSWSLFIVREQMRPTEAFDRIYAGQMGKMGEGLVRLVCIATGRPDTPALRIVALTLIGQVMMFRSARATCMRLLGQDGVDDPLRTEIQATIAFNIDAILDRMIAQPEAAA